MSQAWDISWHTVRPQHPCHTKPARKHVPTAWVKPRPLSQQACVQCAVYIWRVPAIAKARLGDTVLIEYERVEEDEVGLLEVGEEGRAVRGPPLHLQRLLAK